MNTHTHTHQVHVVLSEVNQEVESDGIKMSHANISPYCVHKFVHKCAFLQCLKY